MREVVVKAVCDAVWRGEIDQMKTAEIALAYGVPRYNMLRLLHKIVAGTSKDPRFVRDEEIGGVKVADGSTFTYGSLSLNGDYGTESGPRHFVWFCT
jgi:hypothetical protein